MTTTPGPGTEPRRPPTAWTLALGAIRTIDAHATPARRPRGRVPVTVYFQAAANAGRAARAVRRLRCDPAVPAILAGTYYTDPDAGRELTGRVEQLLSGLAGDAGFGAQAAAVAVLELTHRHAFLANQLVTAAQVYERLEVAGPVRPGRGLG